MIYAVTPQKYPQNFIEEIKYKDENDFEWRIARVENGLYERLSIDDRLTEDEV
jgi:hypothetical protein